MKKETYKSGSWNAICDRCGFRYKADKLKEEWTGLYVCKGCWEPRHPQDFLRGREEDTSVPFSRPDDDGTGAAGTDVDGNSTQPTYVNTLPDVPDGTFDGTL